MSVRTMRDVYVAGVGMTPFGRFLDTTLAALAARAVRDALGDAGVDAGSVETIAFGNSTQGALEGQHGIRGQTALDGMGFGHTAIVNVENACASASTALNLAYLQVASGAVDCALAVGAEKMVNVDPSRSLAAFDGSWDVHRKEETLAGLRSMAEGVDVPGEAGNDAQRSVFMEVYAAFARHHMKTYGTSQRDLAAVSSKNHAHSVENVRSQFRRPFSIDEVLAARSIAWPLTLPMCSPVSDGAAAAVVCSAAFLNAREGLGRATRLRASVLLAGGRWDADDLENHVAVHASRRAYAMADVLPGDVDVVKCHDATAFGEILQSETLGFYPFGEGAAAARRGETALGGKLPINPSGGLESRGHPIGATGLAQIFELVQQLRGECGARQVEGARIALAENGGGLRGIEEAAIAVTILEGPPAVAR